MAEKERKPVPGPDGAVAPVRVVIPMVHQLFHRPRPVPTVLEDGRVLWRCSCGEWWVDE